MIDYIVRYTYGIDDILFDGDTIITIEEFIEDQLDLEEILLEKLKEEIECTYIEIEDFQPLVKQENLYRFEYKDAYGEDKARYDYDKE